MGDLGDVYESTRSSIIDLVRSHEDELDRVVPATPDWSVRDVISHLVGDVECILRGDFPREFFRAFGDSDAVTSLNEWTRGHVETRKDRSLDEIVGEWDKVAPALISMIRSETEWPQGVAPFADRVIVTDLGVHQQDLFGAFGVERDREGPAVKIGSSAYMVTLDFRLQSDDVGAVAIETPSKRWVAGGDDPVATLRTDRYELFRALSGRRSPGQIRSYDWDGDPEPFIGYFYPYGVREEALAE